MKNKRFKKVIIDFMKELICYVVVLVVVVIIGNKFWKTKVTTDNIIGITVGFIIWKIILYILDKHKYKK